MWEVESLTAKRIDWYKLWSDLAAVDGGSYPDEKERSWIRQKWSKAYDDASLELGKQAKIGKSIAWNACVGRGLKEANLEIKVGTERRTWLLRKNKELKGLRNRRRIYGDIEEILRRIAAL